MGGMFHRGISSMPSTIVRRCAAALLAGLIAAVPGTEAAFAQAAPSSGSEMSLEDLGFSGRQLQGDAQAQAVLDRRSRTLRTHQMLGLATAAPMAAALFSGGGAGGGRGDRNLHTALGLTTAGLYFSTAGFAIAAPEGPSRKRKGMTRLHRALAFVHLPMMILAPIAGLQAKKQRDRGESVHGLGAHHSTFAGIAFGTYMGAMLAMTINF